MILAASEQVVVQKVNKVFCLELRFQIKMSDSSGGGDLLGPTQSTSSTNQSTPGQDSRTSAWAGAGGLGGNNSNNRTFAEIIEHEKSTRNILEIHLSRTSTDSANTARYLTYDDLGELIFDIIKINPNDCIGFDYNTGR